MKRRGPLGALVLGGSSFAAVLMFGVAAVPAEQAEAEAPPAPATTLARIGKMNADAAALEARRRQASARRNDAL
jgi:hypothetical protein